MPLRVVHSTTYQYTEPALQCRNEARLTPRASRSQHVLESRIDVTPAAETMRAWKDYFGNEVHIFEVNDLHEDLVVTATSLVRVEPRPLPEPGATPSWEIVSAQAESLSGEADFEAAQFLYDSSLVRRQRAYAAYARTCFRDARPLFDAALELNERIHRDFEYDAKATRVDTHSDEVFQKRRGVCQDFAHFMIACLRSLGIPARYVSGYLKSRPGYVGTEASHAWVSVFCPPHGWIDLDPTNAVTPKDSHVTLCWGRDYRDVPPVRGVTLGGGEHEILVSVGVTEEGASD